MKIKYYDTEYLRPFYVRRRAMFNSMANRCGCGKQASFNYPNIKKPVCCKDCKFDGMVNVRNKRL